MEFKIIYINSAAILAITYRQSDVQMKDTSNMFKPSAKIL